MTNIYTFASNLAGRHGAGSALEARRHHGAVYGRGSGRQGNSYAIPTKDYNLQTMPIKDIKPFVDDFIDYAKVHPELTFQLVRIGCGLAGYQDDQIAPLFSQAPANCQLPTKWITLLHKELK